MNFRDKINNALQNATDEGAERAKRKQEMLQKEVDGVCDWVRCRIEGKASRHTNPNIPFKANLYFVCSLGDAYITREVERIGTSAKATRVNQLTLSQDFLTQEKLIREQLKADGITVGKGAFYSASVPYGDNVTPIPRYSCSYARAFGVYEVDEVLNATRVNIDPYKPITTTSRYGLFANTWIYTYSQGGNSIRPQQGLDLYLLMPISFS
jgi:hypothetical protein